MKLLEVDRRLARKLCGLTARDHCLVTLVTLVLGDAAPRLITIPGHYVDAAGKWIYTPGKMCRRPPIERYRRVAAKHYVEVDKGWLTQLRYGPWVPSNKEEA